MSGPDSPRAAGAHRPWGPQRAERHLRSLELFGMRFGLDRIRRLMTALGSPQLRFATVHVVGTNGKSSTTRMIAAILERHGLRTGAYLSPHLISYTERVQVGERDIAPDELAGAIERAAWAADHVNHTLAEDDHVTQFELITAAAFWELARREVDVVAVEAGLGGRYDATNVIDAPVCVLTNVGLEHTRWLGPTAADIAAEKLAVVPGKATLVVGPGLQPEVAALARATARAREGRLIEVAEPTAHALPAMDELPALAAPRAVGTPPGAGAPPAGSAVLAATGPCGSPLASASAPPFQRRNFAVACAAASAHLRSVGITPRPDAFAAAATAAAAVPGRFEVVGSEPLTVLDGAHNPAAAEALAEALPALARGRAVGLVLGVLEDKDAVGMLRTLLPHCERAWFTAPPGPRALPPAALLSLASQLGFGEAALSEPRPERALSEATRWARAWRATGAGDRASARDRVADADGAVARAGRAPGAMVLATGSIYLVGELLAALGRAREPEPATQQSRGIARPTDK